MEKKVYLVYASSRGCKDVVAATMDKARAFEFAQAHQALNDARKGRLNWYKINYRVYEINSL